MTLQFRPATTQDIPRVVDLLLDDPLGAGREGTELAPYLAAFDQMSREAGNQLWVGVLDGRVVATYQLTIISGLSRTATRRAHLEAVRVDASLRSQGFGADLMADVERRARDAGCAMIQFTSDKTRRRAHDFYRRLGFVPSHEGFKRLLD